MKQVLLIQSEQLNGGTLLLQVHNYWQHGSSAEAAAVTTKMGNIENTKARYFLHGMAVAQINFFFFFTTLWSSLVCLV